MTLKKKDIERRQTNRQTDRDGISMTDATQRAKSVKSSYTEIVYNTRSMQIIKIMVFNNNLAEILLLINDQVF